MQHGDHAPLTADGEAFDPTALAAGHQTVQLPAIARVTNIENGRQILLRINDRGPAALGRILELTPRAAELLQATDGTRIRVQVLTVESRSLAEQLRAKARFAWRTRKLAALRRAQCAALESAARRRLPAYDRLDAAQRIGVLSNRSGVDASALSAALADEFRGAAEAELAAIALLETARRTLEFQPLLSRGASQP